MFLNLFRSAAAVIGAGVFAQFPEFYQQYLQRLGGRLDQARLDLEMLQRDAAALGRSVAVYLDELLASGTSAARHAAQRELARLDNASELESAYEALRLAAPLERPFVLARHLDAKLAEDTLAIFAPALPATSEGVIYGAFGMLVALGFVATGTAGARGAKRRMNGRHRGTAGP